MSEEEILKDIRETNYNEQNVEELLYELKNDTGTYSCYDNAMAIIYYKNLYKQEKEKNKELEKDNKNLNILLDAKYKDVTYMLLNYVSNDKIRKKIEEIEKEIEIEGLSEKDNDLIYTPYALYKYAQNNLKQLLEEV